MIIALPRAVILHLNDVDAAAAAAVMLPIRSLLSSALSIDLSLLFFLWKERTKETSD